ncbi:MAG: hypothetical protein P4L71_16580 [Acetobacteraceae bacterium]|nr:hypothetical protein [Acetobacteraceae bacterium]
MKQRIKTRKDDRQSMMPSIRQPRALLLPASKTKLTSIAGRLPREKGITPMPRSLLLLVGLLFATTMLSGCVIEEPGHHGWGWGWHHHGDR